MIRLPIIALLVSVLISMTGCHSGLPFEKEKEELLQDAKLIIYCKSYIKDDKYVIVFDKVLWGELDNKPEGVIETQEMDSAYDDKYADAQIMFYQNNKMEGANMYWPVYEGRILAWEDKDISEFIEYLKNEK